MSSGPVSSAVAFRASRKTAGFNDAVHGLAMGTPACLPVERDLRAGRGWWTIQEQGQETDDASLAVAADSVIRWHLVESGKLPTDQRLAPRFLEMASDLGGHPGNTRRRLRSLLDVARRFGCVREIDLAEAAEPTQLPGEAHRLLFARAARYRISAYVSLGAEDLGTWRRWLATFGPILTWLHVDDAWNDATAQGGKLERYDPPSSGAAQAVALVGYRADGSFIVRNSRGAGWGDSGYAYASESYARSAFMEAYGLAV